MSCWMDRILRCGLAVSLTLASAPLIHATSYDARPGHGELSQAEIAQELASEEWIKRSQAVAALQSVPAENWTPAVKDALIETFGIEQQRLRDKLEGSVPSSFYPEIAREAFGEYYSALAGLVMKLNDPRALPLIVNFPTLPDRRVLTYIAQRGRSAFPLVLARLNRAGRRSDVGPEWAMLDTLTELVLLNHAQQLKEPLSASDLASIRTAALRFLDDRSPWVATHAARTLAIVAAPEDREGVRETFAQLLKDPDHNRREIALSAMRDITDPRFVPVDQLMLVARQDDFRLAGPTSHYPAGAYPLRHEAEEVLKRVHKAQ